MSGRTHSHRAAAESRGKTLEYRPDHGRDDIGEEGIQHACHDGADGVDEDGGELIAKAVDEWWKHGVAPRDLTEWLRSNALPRYESAAQEASAKRFPPAR